MLKELWLVLLVSSFSPAQAKDNAQPASAQEMLNLFIVEEHTVTANIIRSKGAGQMRQAKGSTLPRTIDGCKKFDMTTIFFDVDKSHIKPESYFILGQFAQFVLSPIMRQHKHKIIGHTDPDGDNEYNLRLSRKRALAVKAYLVDSFQINANKLFTYGLGEKDLKYSDDGRADKRESRRVEVETCKNIGIE